MKTEKFERLLREGVHEMLSTMGPERAVDLQGLHAAVEARTSQDVTFFLGYVVGRCKAGGVGAEELLELVALTYGLLPER